MKLNRYNYEEYFILYMDNELGSDGRREVEAFVQANPDLKGELDILTQTKLKPDTDISFADKGSLLRFDNSSISLANYEEWLTAYIDDEVTSEQRIEIEKLVAANPAVLSELNLLKRVKLQPETIVFPDKESLYRKTEKARVISIRWMRIAAAAILLFAISTTAIIFIKNNKSVGRTDFANQGKTISPKLNVEEPKKNEQPVTNALANNSDKQNPDVTEDKTNKKLTRNDHATIAAVVLNAETIDKDVQDGTTEGGIVPGDGKLKRPSENPGTFIPNVNHADAQTGNAATVSATRLKEKMAIVVTTPTDNSYNNTETGDVTQNNPDVEFAGGSNKGIRGFFRKVTRTIEKRTNIKTTDDDGRLLIAGLAIKTN